MLARISRPKYPNAALGIESLGMSAVALKSSGRGQFTIKQAGSIELPPGLINPSFLDQNISDNAEFASYLREVVEIAGLLRQKRWSIALPSTTARTAILALDSEPASKKEAEEVLNWKAEQTFGAPAAELRIAKQRISPSREGKSRFFATAVRLSVIDEYESHIYNMKWKAGLILPRAVGEANWLMDRKERNDSLLISGNNDGFTALLLRGSDPAVVRSVTCTPNEIDDEIYRLLMFYNDRFGGGQGSGLLERLLVIGKSLIPSKIHEIASEALGKDLKVLSHQEVGLNLPGGEFNFNDIAAPAGLASLGA